MTKAKEYWRELLQIEVNSKRPLSQIAAQLGVSRPMVSAIVNESPTSPYVTGAASTAKFGERVVAVFGRFDCPHLSSKAGEAHIITGLLCRDYALREQPTSSPHAAEHWRACQVCERKPAPLQVREVVRRGPKAGCGGEITCPHRVNVMQYLSDLKKGKVNNLSYMDCYRTLPITSSVITSQQCESDYRQSSPWDNPIEGESSAERMVRRNQFSACSRCKLRPGDANQMKLNLTEG